MKLNLKNMASCRSILFLVIVVIIPFFLYAGTTGKISGTIKDAATGEPLQGATVILEGTALGTVSDQNGRFFIINIPPGSYSLKATYVGYKKYHAVNVEVAADLTTQWNIALEASAVEVGETVVYAERPLIQKDVTSKLTIVSADELSNLPLNNVQDVIATKAGFTTDANGDLHARGGRSGEIAYLVDGMYVEDPLNGNYNSTINKDAVQELSVVSGSFNAEYGQAMSAIVNIVTKDGGDTFHGKVEYTSGMLNSSPYHQKNPFDGVADNYDYTFKSVIDRFSIKPWSLELPISGTLSATFGGPIAIDSNLSYFVSGKYQNEDSYLPHGYNLGRDALAKLSYRFSPSIKLSLFAQATQDEWQNYNHAWKYLSDHQAHELRNAERLGILWTDVLSDKLFYTVQVSEFINHYKEQVGDKTPDEYVEGQTGEDTFFYIKGDDSPYIDDKTITTSGKFDITYQLNNFHQFKSGFEVKTYSIKAYEESEPWTGGANFKDDYTRYPFEGDAYIQDKIEYEYLILNLGLRFDYVDPRASMWPDVMQNGYYDANNVWIPAVDEKVLAKTQLSPRIGLAHPITDRAVLHFSYGHFFQNPDYRALYYNSSKNLSSALPILGNPRVNPQKTVAYEAGIKYQLSNDWALEVSGWYKDITNLLSTYEVSYLSQDYIVYYNSDYASVKGVDVTLNKRYSDYLSGSINYTFMVAKGNNSSPLGGYISAYSKEEIPHKEYYLDFDQTHNIVVSANLAVPHGKGFNVWGVHPLSDFNLNVLVQAASGLPYTPYVDATTRVDVNSARMPWTANVDVRASKKFLTGWGTAASAFLEVTNLFNRENVVKVQTRTGKPFDTGVTGYVGESPDAEHDPTNIGPPRIIKVGLQFSW
jgi:outer membrane receptor protein involved in Fe transport